MDTFDFSLFRCLWISRFWPMTVLSSKLRTKFQISWYLISCELRILHTPLWLDYYTFYWIQTKDLNNPRINQKRRSSKDLDIHNSNVFSSVWIYLLYTHTRGSTLLNILTKGSTDQVVCLNQRKFSFWLQKYTALLTRSMEWKGDSNDAALPYDYTCFADGTSFE